MLEDAPLASSSNAGVEPAAESAAAEVLAVVAVAASSDSAMANVEGRDIVEVEGVRVASNDHGVIDMPGSYRRVSVMCPHHACRPPCRKTRQFRSRFNAKSPLGDLEPYAFLGCWLEGASRFSDGKGHKDWAPGPAEVEDYAVRQSWISRAQK